MASPSETAIFGGGVAGLAVAAALSASGRSCRVYERRAAGAAPGMGFILSPQVLTDLDRVGVPLPAAATGVWLRRFRHYRPDGGLRQVREIPGQWRAVRRADLLRALRDRLPSPAVATGAELAKLVLDADGGVAEARLAGGERVHADLYVAGDGARSLARQAMFPTWPQRPARVVEIVALARHAGVSEWAGADFHKFTTRGASAGLVPVGDQTVVWYIQFDRERFRPPATGDRPAAAVARQVVGGWAEPVGELLRVTDFRQAHVWRPIDADLLPRFHSGDNLVLVGDAAHPLLPFTSQGVAAAIAGARDLVAALDTHPSVGAALRAYSTSCHARCAPYVRQGRELTRRFLHPDGRAGDALPLAV